MAGSCPGVPRRAWSRMRKTWMPGTRPGMTAARWRAIASPLNRLRHPAENTADQAGAPFARRLCRFVLGDAAPVKIIQELDVVGLGDGETLLTHKHRVGVEEWPDERHRGRRGGVLRDHELRWLPPMPDQRLLDIKQLAHEFGRKPRDG